MNNESFFHFNDVDDGSLAGGLGDEPDLLSNPGDDQYVLFGYDNNGTDYPFLMASTTMKTTTAVEASGIIPSNPSKFGLDLDVSVQIGVYSLIFILAVIGNILVITTLVQNRVMRTITNLFLMNLAISDILVAVFCIPVTLVGIVLKDFLFGEVLCKLIPYLQAVSVSVSAWSLVAISVERYYAICHPLRSRSWQTLSHAYKIIAIVWALSLIFMFPIPLFSILLPVRNSGRHKCREIWPNHQLEKIYTVFLDIILLILPLVIMTVKYSLIMMTLWPAAQNEEAVVNEQSSSMLGTPTGSPSSWRAHPISPGPDVGNSTQRGLTATGTTHSFRLPSTRKSGSSKNKLNNVNNSTGASTNNSGGGPGLGAPVKPSILSRARLASRHGGGPSHFTKFSTQGNCLNENGLRSTNVAKSLSRKKHVIQMLFVLVIEFFIAWSPLYCMNTWYQFNPEGLYNLIGPLGVSSIHLLSFSSVCTNPITYCFMNKNFRNSFLSVFGCNCKRENPSQVLTSRHYSVSLSRNRSIMHHTNNYNNKPSTTDDV